MLSAIKKGDSHKVSMEKAIDLGIIGEKNILGRYASGVFSFADLEANFQGLLFGIKLLFSDFLFGNFSILLNCVVVPNH